MSLPVPRQINHRISCYYPRSTTKYATVSSFRARFEKSLAFTKTLSACMTTHHPKVIPSIALIGLGRRTRTKVIPAILPLLRRKEIEIAFAVDPLGEIVEELPAVPIHKKLPNFPPRAAEVSASPRFAYVAIPHYEHQDVCLKLMQAGYHILKEKPLAINLNNGRILAQEALRNKCRLRVACQRRLSPRYATFRKWLSLLGTTRSVYALETICIDNVNEGWRANKSKSGGGVVLDMGYHMLDQLISAFGNEFDISSSVLLRSRAGRYNVEDTAHIGLNFKGQIHASIVLSILGQSQREEIFVVGERGTLKLDTNSVRICYKDNYGEQHTEVFLSQDDNIEIMAQNFSKMIAHTEFSEDKSLQGDLDVLRLIDRIYATSTTIPQGALEIRYGRA